MGRCRFAGSGQHLTHPLLHFCISGLNCPCVRVGSIFFEKLDDFGVEIPVRIPLHDRQRLGKRRRLFQSHAEVRASKTSTTNILPVWGVTSLMRTAPSRRRLTQRRAIWKGGRIRSNPSQYLRPRIAIFWRLRRDPMCLVAFVPVPFSGRIAILTLLHIVVGTIKSLDARCALARFAMPILDERGDHHQLLRARHESSSA